MSRSLKDLRGMLSDELDEIASKGEMSAGSLDAVDKLTHAIKSIDTILMYETSGYSNGRIHTEPYWRGYSRTDSREAMIDRLRTMMDDAPSDKERSAIRRCMKELEA